MPLTGEVDFCNPAAGLAELSLADGKKFLVLLQRFAAILLTRPYFLLERFDFGLI